MTTKTTTETVAELHAAQMIVPDWMRNLGPLDAHVRVTRQYTPFGVFVVHAELEQENAS
jgi:hypothetical protein